MRCVKVGCSEPSILEKQMKPLLIHGVKWALLTSLSSAFTQSGTEMRGRLVSSNAAGVDRFRAPLSHLLYQSITVCPAVAIFRAMNVFAES